MVTTERRVSLEKGGEMKVRTDESANERRDGEQIGLDHRVLERLNDCRCEVGKGIQGHAIAEEGDGEKKDLGRLEGLKALVPAEPVGFGTGSGGGVERETASDMSLLLGCEEARTLRCSGQKPEKSDGEEEGEETLQLRRWYDIA